MNARMWTVIGAPSSAGAHTPGVERAPAALRAAGLLDLLGRHAPVEDSGDTREFRWRPDPAYPRGQHAGAVAAVASEVAALVATAVAGGPTPLVLGGDCTVTSGLVAGQARAGRSPALVYVDGGPDLYTPLTRPHGNLDATGLAHLLGLPGTLPEVAGVGPTAPLLTPDRVVVYGDSLPRGDHERELVASPRFAGLSVTEINPDHLPDGEVLPAFVRSLAGALAAG
ncbi:arginase family protein [Micromonospora sp. NPDC050980]|uniref:arginase family protein n=1 Tax=Micromonospora sp. NPDC050980 TaxID=3155161 RepID=UPI0033CF4407